MLKRVYTYRTKSQQRQNLKRNRRENELMLRAICGACFTNEQQCVP